MTLDRPSTDTDIDIDTHADTDIDTHADTDTDTATATATATGIVRDPWVRANRAEAARYVNDSMTNEEYMEALTDYLRLHRMSLLAA